MYCKRLLAYRHIAVMNNNVYDLQYNLGLFKASGTSAKLRTNWETIMIMSGEIGVESRVAPAHP